MVTEGFRFARQYRDRKNERWGRRFSRIQVRRFRLLKRLAIRRDRQAVIRFLNQEDWEGGCITAIPITECDMEPWDLILPDRSKKHSWEEWKRRKNEKE